MERREGVPVDPRNAVKGVPVDTGGTSSRGNVPTPLVTLHRYELRTGLRIV
jgi:hypothetical protein